MKDGENKYVGREYLMGCPQGIKVGAGVGMIKIHCIMYKVVKE